MPMVLPWGSVEPARRQTTGLVDVFGGKHGSAHLRVAADLPDLVDSAGLAMSTVSSVSSVSSVSGSAPKAAARSVWCR
ncbi:hypothetical protein [Streptomyces sp. NPDC051776]|uniref:hypothetical protein n=1 Tax=Streptomyces sp. NPDC051776 TaxID=3155414 RepID=UPI00343F4C87